MQTNPAAEQSNNIKWSESPWNQSGMYKTFTASQSTDSISCAMYVSLTSIHINHIKTFKLDFVNSVHGTVEHVHVTYAGDNQRPRPRYNVCIIHQIGFIKHFTRFCCNYRFRSRGVVRGRHAPPIIDWVELSGDWLCWDVGPALFSKVTLFSLSEVRSVVFCGPQISQIYWARCCTGRRSSTFLRKKCIPSQLYSPNLKSWLHACLGGAQKQLLIDADGVLDKTCEFLAGITSSSA